MKLYCGIDLHSNNSVVVVIDEQDKPILSKKCANDISVINGQLAPFSEDIQTVVVESTYNSYWLVDGLEDAGFHVKLANTAAIQQYSGIKHTDDKSDARFLANLLRLDILPVGHIMPREQRNIRDLLRKRSLLIKQRTMLNLNLQGMIARHTGARLSANQLKRIDQKAIEELMAEQVVRDSAMINLMQIEAIIKSVKLLEQRVSGYSVNTTENKLLQSIPGVGQILSQMIALESGSYGPIP
ncbi:IS110 family transposase [Microbulbifer aggregans]|uniref:IS110 family transposase n=1 Tax=Microbulbifer aggregans TaxID=1769779 RepID=UPI001CFDD338|nr:transposase [Microbulbifer aggregans]